MLHQATCKGRERRGGTRACGAGAWAGPSAAVKGVEEAESGELSQPRSPSKDPTGAAQHPEAAAKYARAPVGGGLARGSPSYRYSPRCSGSASARGRAAGRGAGPARSGGPGAAAARPVQAAVGAERLGSER